MKNSTTNNNRQLPPISKSNKSCSKTSTNLSTSGTKVNKSLWKELKEVIHSLCLSRRRTIDKERTQLNKKIEEVVKKEEKEIRIGKIDEKLKTPYNEKVATILEITLKTVGALMNIGVIASVGIGLPIITFVVEEALIELKDIRLNQNLDASDLPNQITNLYIDILNLDLSLNNKKKLLSALDSLWKPVCRKYTSRLLSKPREIRDFILSKTASNQPWYQYTTNLKGEFVHKIDVLGTLKALAITPGTTQAKESAKNLVKKSRSNFWNVGNKRSTKKLNKDIIKLSSEYTKEADNIGKILKLITSASNSNNNELEKKKKHIKKLGKRAIIKSAKTLYFKKGMELTALKKLAEKAKENYKYLRNAPDNILTANKSLTKLALELIKHEDCFNENDKIEINKLIQETFEPLKETFEPLKETSKHLNITWELSDID
jgi:hypothetical protein